MDEQGRTVGFGIDIGGSGIKGGRVDLDTGLLIGDRIKILTPKKATAKNVVPIVAEILAEAEWTGPYGCTFPGVVRQGVIYTAANLGKAWIGVDFAEELRSAADQPVVVLNDADAAGIAEVRYGAAKDLDGVVILTTLGTGIGTAIVNDGHLLPNTELGHLKLHGDSAEKYAASSAKDRDDLSYHAWAKRLQEYYSHLEFLTSPDVIIVGGGISRKSEKFLPLIETTAELIPAELRNTAGIVGAAMTAHEQFDRSG